MSAMASQITSLTIVYALVYSGADQRKHQSSASLAFVLRGIHRWPVNSPHKEPVTREMFPFDDVIIHWVQFQCRELPWVYAHTMLNIILYMIPILYEFCFFSRYIHNSMRLSDTDMHLNWAIIGSDNGLSPVAKSWSEPMLAYAWLSPREQLSVEFEAKFNNFHTRKWIWNIVCKMVDILAQPQGFASTVTG